MNDEHKNAQKFDERFQSLFFNEEKLKLLVEWMNIAAKSTRFCGDDDPPTQEEMQRLKEIPKEMGISETLFIGQVASTLGKASKILGELNIQG